MSRGFSAVIWVSHELLLNKYITPFSSQMLTAFSSPFPFLVEWLTFKIKNQSCRALGLLWFVTVFQPLEKGTLKRNESGMKMKSVKGSYLVLVG